MQDWSNHCRSDINILQEWCNHCTSDITNWHETGATWQQWSNHSKSDATIATISTVVPPFIRLARSSGTLGQPLASQLGHSRSGVTTSSYNSVMGFHLTIKLNTKIRNPTWNMWVNSGYFGNNFARVFQRDFGCLVVVVIINFWLLLIASTYTATEAARHIFEGMDANSVLMLT